MQVKRSKRTHDVGLRRHRKKTDPDAGVLCTHEVMKVTKVAHRFLQPGTVVRADIPFADGTGRKVRPSVVVSASRLAVELIPCTSSPRATKGSDVAINDLPAAGLHKPTRARTGRTVSVDRVAVVQVLGRLSSADLVAVLTFDHEVA